MDLDEQNLIAALDEPLAVARNAAAQELGKRKTRAAVDKLIAILVSDTSALVRDNAAFSLGLIGDEKAVPALLDALRDRDEWVRKSAVKALGYLRPKECVDALIGLIDDPSPTVRKNVARTLGEIGDRKACGALEKLLGDPNILVKKFSQAAIERLK